MTLSVDISRRGFVGGAAAAAAGFALGFKVPLLSGQAVAETMPDEINAWVVVKPDDTVVIRIARSEMGQGTLTGLAQLVAEELNCDWSKVTTEYPTPGTNLKRNRVWKSFSTGGSRGIRESAVYVREGGAVAREMLIAAAAKEWGVPASECKAEKSVITHTPSGKKTTYGKVAAAAGKMEPPKEVKLKDPKDWTIAGKPLKRLDTADKLNGKQVYGIDLKMPGMLNAAIKDCPVTGGKVASVDDAKAKAMPGVKKVVRVGESAVAVVADTWWQAKTALDAINITWDYGPNGKVSSASLAEFLKEGLTADKANVGNQNGDALAAIAGAARKIEAVYSYPFQNHAPMEPMNATAIWTADKCEVWCPTQNGEASLAACSEAAGLPQNVCDVYKLLLGGGFGRRGAFQDYVTQVVKIAKEFPGTPIKLIWTREEDMLHGHYHPLTQCKLTAGLDDKGNIQGLHIRISGQSILTSVAPERMVKGVDLAVFQTMLPGGEHSISYEFPNLLIDHALRQPHILPGFWRGVNVNQNTIYMECFLDELAHATGQDALEFRRKLMAKYPKNLAVLNAVAERAGWGKKLEPGHGMGLATCTAYGSHIAGCAEVSVKDGKVKVHRIVAATDSGYAVNPQQIEAQVEGSFAYGLSAALYQEITVKDGKVEQENFDTYPAIRIDEMPDVETLIMPSGGFWGG
ncbi:MAG: molybdopterin cofactor-binding domain-containing protein, partial [Rhodomicrobium sp.]